MNGRKENGARSPVYAVQSVRHGLRITQAAHTGGVLVNVRRTSTQAAHGTHKKRPCTALRRLVALACVPCTFATGTPCGGLCVPPLAFPCVQYARRLYPFFRLIIAACVPFENYNTSRTRAAFTYLLKYSQIRRFNTFSTRWLTGVRYLNSFPHFAAYWLNKRLICFLLPLSVFPQ